MATIDFIAFLDTLAKTREYAGFIPQVNKYRQPQHEKAKPYIPDDLLKMVIEFESFAKQMPLRQNQ